MYGPGNGEIHRRVGRRIGRGRLAIFLHLGGANQLPLSYVDNCADAIVLAGITKGADGEVFNVVDDDLPTSRSFLKLYQRKVRPLRSIPIPYGICYAVSALWEKYSAWSTGQRAALNRRKCEAAWKGNRFSNAKLKEALDWNPKVSFEDAFSRYAEYQKSTGLNQ